MVDNSISPLQTSFKLFFAMIPAGQATSAWSDAYPTSSADPITHHSTA